MAPEQLEGQEADARADLFAFGAVVTTISGDSVSAPMTVVMNWASALERNSR